MKLSLLGFFGLLAVQWARALPPGPPPVPARGLPLAAQSSRIMLYRGCGGAYGDPFAGLAVKNGVLLINHYGSSSSWRWGVTSRFRYQQGGFNLIGETTTYGRVDGNCPGLDGPAGWDYRDTNYLTGTYEVKKISEACKLLTHKRGQAKPTVQLNLLLVYLLQGAVLGFAYALLDVGQQVLVVGRSWVHAAELLSSLRTGLKPGGARKLLMESADQQQ